MTFITICNINICIYVTTPIHFYVALYSEHNSYVPVKNPPLLYTFPAFLHFCPIQTSIFLNTIIVIHFLKAMSCDIGQRWVALSAVRDSG